MLVSDVRASDPSAGGRNCTCRPGPAAPPISVGYGRPDGCAMLLGMGTTGRVFGLADVVRRPRRIAVAG